MERILQFNNRSQPLECGIQTGSRKEEKQHTDNNIPETRRLTNKGHKRNPQAYIKYFTPEDNELEDNYHKQVRDKTTRPPNTPDDCEFTVEEIRRVIEGMDNKKAPGEDGIPAEIFKQTFKILQKA